VSQEKEEKRKHKERGEGEVSFRLSGDLFVEKGGGKKKGAKRGGRGGRLSFPFLAIPQGKG